MSARLPVEWMGTERARLLGACMWPDCRRTLGISLGVLDVVVGPLCDEHLAPIERDVSTFWLNARSWTTAETTERLAELDAERARVEARHDEALRRAEQWREVPA